MSRPCELVNSLKEGHKAETLREPSSGCLPPQTLRCVRLALPGWASSPAELNGLTVYQRQEGLSWLVGSLSDNSPVGLSTGPAMHTHHRRVDDDLDSEDVSSAPTIRDYL